MKKIHPQLTFLAPQGALKQDLFFICRAMTALLRYLLLLKPRHLSRLSLWVSFYSPRHAGGIKKKIHPRWFSEITKTLDMTSILIANIWVCVPKSKRCSALRRSTPAGLLKKCAALNLPNYRRFGCEAETKAENYTCRMENNREGADKTWGKQDNDF